MRWIVRFSPTLVLTAWAIASAAIGVRTIHVGFMVVLALAMAISKLERHDWKRRKGISV